MRAMFFVCLRSAADVRTFFKVSLFLAASIQCHAVSFLQGVIEKLFARRANTFCCCVCAWRAQYWASRAHVCAPTKQMMRAARHKYVMLLCLASLLERLADSALCSTEKQNRGAREMICLCKRKYKTVNPEMTETTS